MNKKLAIVAALLLGITSFVFAGITRVSTIEYSGPEEYRDSIYSLFLKYSSVVNGAKVSVEINNTEPYTYCDIYIGKNIKISTMLLENDAMYLIEINGYRDGFIVDDYKGNSCIHIKKDGSYSFIKFGSVLGLELDSEKQSNVYKMIAKSLYLVLGTYD